MAADRLADTFAVILAGGRGTRLWPLSRPTRPKQFLPLSGRAESMLQQTINRAHRLVPPERVVVVGDAAHKSLLEGQAGSARVLLEPQGRNTSVAIAMAATWIRHHAPHATLVVLSADHVIAEGPAWFSAMSAAADHAARHPDLVTIGTKPEAPETRFGYMISGARVAHSDGLELFRVLRFVEKPESELLRELLETGRCLRNMGMFAWRTDTFLRAVERHLPDVFATACRWRDAGFPEDRGGIPAAYYEELPAVSVDHGVLQQVDNLVVVESRVERIDVGDYSAFAMLWPADGENNAVTGRYLGHDSHRNVVYSDDPLIATVGIDDHVIVVDGDVVLVCPKSRTQDIRGLLETMRQAKTRSGSDERGAGESHG